MDYSIISFIALVSVMVLGNIQESQGEQITQCYVCSWQKPSRGLNLSDNCSHYNFKPEYASIVNCTTGCEAVTYRHSKNEEVYHFARNCLNTVELEGRDSCLNTDLKFEYTTRCECYANLCNRADEIKRSGVGGTILSVILMGVVKRILE